MGNKNKKNKKIAQEEQSKAPKRTRVEYRGHTAVQSGFNHHILIGKGGKVVSHVHATRPYTEKELEDAIDNYITLRQRLG